ncbi:MAG: Holliday junction branch migration protein RuvA [Candidatus Latescibacteria bacterium]|nr:Holliday junction branch migration protein RuvA [bacterium]MBD3423947.1 Holliday junction branch migration protein RuvA [Candidatus Latescibacterota bacterium]
MIATIQGILRGRLKDSIILETGNYGIQVYVPEKLLLEIGPEGEQLRLFTYMHVREDAITLYGFRAESDKRIFLALLGVSGIGPRVAMGIISAAGASEIASYITAEDTTSLTRFPGVGKKTAERIVLELKDRLEPADYGVEETGSAGAMDSELLHDAVAALCSLGFSRKRAEVAVGELEPFEIEEGWEVGDVVREVLRRYPPGGVK